MKYFKEELVERIKDAIVGQLALAMSRNVEYIMKDLEKSIQGDGGSDEPMKVVVKMSFWSDGPERASTKIESVAWERKLQYKDDEFPLLKIDLNQPGLPGLLEQCQKIADERFAKEGREVIELIDKMKKDGVTVSVEVEKGTTPIEDLVSKAKEMIASEGIEHVTISMLQRKLTIGYIAACDVLAELAKSGVIVPKPNGIHEVKTKEE